MQICGFKEVPVITTSMEGIGKHGQLAGSSSIQGAEATLFYILIYDSWVELEKEDAVEFQWNIEWIAVGHVC